MKKMVKIVVGVVMVALIGVAAVVGADNDLRASINGTFVGQDFAYTNLLGTRIELTFVKVSGSLSASTNSYVTVTQNSQTYILVQDNPTNTLYWIGEGISLERNGILTFFASSSGTATNSYRIESR